MIVSSKGETEPAADYLTRREEQKTEEQKYQLKCNNMNQLFLQLAQSVTGNVITIVASGTLLRQSSDLLWPGFMPNQFILL